MLCRFLLAPLCPRDQQLDVDTERGTGAIQNYGEYYYVGAFAKRNGLVDVIPRRYNIRPRKPQLYELDDAGDKLAPGPVYRP